MCFGNFVSRFLLEHLFGYDDILMSSFKKIAANVSNKGVPFGNVTLRVKQRVDQGVVRGEWKREWENVKRGVKQEGVISMLV